MAGLHQSQECAHQRQGAGMLIIEESFRTVRISSDVGIDM